PGRGRPSRFHWSCGHFWRPRACRDLGNPGTPLAHHPGRYPVVRGHRRAHGQGRRVCDSGAGGPLRGLDRRFVVERRRPPGRDRRPHAQDTGKVVQETSLMSPKAIKILATCVALAAALGGLMFTTLREGTEYYMHVDEVMNDPAAWQGKRLQLHGYVEDLRQRPNTLDYRFQVKNNG